MLDLVKAEEVNDEVAKSNVNLEHLMFVNNPAMWKEIFGDEQNRIESQAEFFHPSSQEELEEMLKEFRNPTRYSGMPS